MSKSASKNQHEIYAPEMRVTPYDRASSGMVAIVVGLMVAVFALVSAWMMNRSSDVESLVPVEMIEFPGGVEDGAVDETLLVESPEDPVPDAAPEETDEEMEVEEVFDSVTELADVSAEQMLKQYESDAVSSGTTGSREGTGRRALGIDGGQGGLPAEQRWFIQFADQSDIQEYASQLDFFGIELGTILPSGKLVYLSGLSQPKPSIRETTSGKNEKRMYMTWQGGKLKLADRTLFKKVNIDVSTSRVLHFYPRQTETLLATLERDYANRKISDIRRTYFVVEKNRKGYNFRVTRQSYFR